MEKGVQFETNDTFSAFHAHFIEMFTLFAIKNF